MKLASLVIALSGSLLIANAVSAQEAAYAPSSQPVYSSSAPASGAPGTLKDRSAHDRPLKLSAQLYIPWVYGIGIGARLGAEIPVAKDGFISSINDSVAIEPAFFFAYSNYYGYAGLGDANALRFTPAASMLWNFHLKANLAVYGMATLGVEIRRRKYDYGNGVDYTHTFVAPFIEIAGGVKWNFAERIALRAEVGWYGPRCGISFDL